MFSLAHMKVRNKLVLILLFPVAGLLYFAGTGIVEKRKLADEMQALQALSALAVRISALVHETQKERGMTAGFLGSRGQAFREELVAQRSQTDRRISELKDFLKEFDRGRFGSAFERRLEDALNRLASLQEMRERVLALKVSTRDAIASYTAMNASFLNVIAHMSRLSTHGEMARRLAAYVSFLQSKERAGIERAVLANTFVQDRFGPGMFNRFSGLVTAQETYTNVFLSLASPEEKAFYRRRLSGPVVAEVDRMRRIAFARAGRGGFGVDADHWFKTMTAKIDLLKEVEDRLSQGLNAMAEALGRQAQKELTVFLGLTAAAVVLAGVLAVLLARSITRPMKQAVDAAHRLAQGDTSVEIEARGTDEPGQLLAAMENTVRSLKAMSEAAERIAQGDLAVEVCPRSERDALGQSFAEMVRSLRGMSEAAERIAQGDLTVEVKPRSERDVLGRSFAAMVARLSEMVAQIRHASASMVRASGEIATGMEDLAQRTEEQASSLQETVSSMEEMTAAVKQNAENAGKANRLMLQSREVAQEGMQVVSTAVAGMEAIDQASQKIADIIGVIDEIAFQTNLLALNAAVEAARAGEQGRGFAVVAAEVRKLAQRSATAAKDIKALIQDSVKKVQDGTGLVHRSGKAMEEIVASIKQVADLVAGISVASQEQSSGIEQVNQAVMQMDKITQQNAALVEEASVNTKSLDALAQELRALVENFKVKGVQEEPSPVSREAGTDRTAPPPAEAVRRKGRRAAAEAEGSRAFPQAAVAEGEGRPPLRVPGRGQGNGGTNGDAWERFA